MSFDAVRRNPSEYLQKRGLNLTGVFVTLLVLNIVGSETAVFYGALEYALWGYFVTLVLCVLGPLLVGRDAGLFQALALVPVFRLVNLGMPVFFETTLYWLPLIYGPFIPAGYLVATSRPETDLSIGGLRALLVAPIVLPLSAVLGIVEYSLLDPAPLVSGWSVGNLLLIGIVMFGFVAVVEELLYRGIIQRTFEHRFGRGIGIAIASVLFGFMHSGYGIPEEILLATGIGVFFGLIYEYTRSLVLVVLMHGTLNLFLFAVVPYHEWLVEYVYQYIPV